MRGLITGARGFAGWHLARHLAECGDSVLGVERPGIDGEPSDHPTIAWDLRHPPTPDVCRQIQVFAPQAIYHLAAISIPSQCGDQEPTYDAYAVNVRGTARILALASSLRPSPLVMLVSSAYVYAAVNGSGPVVAENAPLGPPNGYGKTKLAAEELAQAAAQNGLQVIIARAFNHTGPRQTDQLMLPEWCRQFAANVDPVVVQCRDAWLDLIDVRDVVRAYRLLVERAEPGEVYNVGGGVAGRSGDILDELRLLADPKRPIRETHPSRRQQPIADISRLTTATGWKPSIPLSATIADTLAYWRSRLALEAAS